MTNVKVDAPLMTEEIFGPVLPIIPVSNIDAAIAFWYVAEPLAGPAASMPF